ncbi:MAG: Fe-S oxidoreductase [Firmicutes bacterium]|nr:Fe-S oxidoreductase [Bacillota bacterium]
MDKGLVVAAVHSGSIAEEMEIQVGDRVLAVNNEELNDLIDFQFGISEEDFTLLIEKSDGELWELEIEKGPGEFLGLEVETVSAKGLKKCNNNCTFCFVAQMPKGMRSTLYDKDDDYRLSLTQGSFITLSNLSEEDITRITSLHLTPMYVSVHDGDVLKETVERLGELYPSVQSIAVVPVGLTRFREKLTPLRGFTADEARKVLDQAETWQKDFFRLTGRHLVYFSDEFYVLAGREFPKFEVYDDFPQLENGVGMARKFISEIEAGWDLLPVKVSKRCLHIITGTAAQELFESWRKRLMDRMSGLTITVHVIHNNFFGLSVTAAGLLTAQDIAQQLGNLQGEEFLIPRTMLKADEDIFLDDLSVEWLEEKVNGKASIVENDGLAFLEHVIGYSLEVERFE